MIRSIVIFGILMSSVALAGPADSIVEYSRDEHYTYAKVPVAIDFEDQDQMDLVHRGVAKIGREIEAALPYNPRVSQEDANVTESAKAAAIYEKKIDDAITFVQKHYGTLVSVGWRWWQVPPTAIMVFGGVAVTGTKFLSLGGSLTVGAVIMPRRVYRKSLDTNREDSYVEWIGAPFMWNSTYLALSSPGAKKTVVPLGAGLVFGTLARPEDFVGMVGTVALPFKTGFWAKRQLKLNVLKNFRKSGFVSNGFVTLSQFVGQNTDLDNPIVGLSAIADLQSIVHDGMDLMQSAKTWLNMPVRHSIEILPDKER